MAGLSVQFVGVGEVLKAFDNKDCVNWSVCQNKAINFSYSGSNMEESRAELEEWLKMISKRTSSAVYTLKFYEDYKQGSRITAQTAEHTSFNFRLYDEETEGSRSVGYPRGYAADMLMEELRSMRAEIKEIKDKQLAPKVGAPQEEQLETWEKILDHPLAMAAIGKILNIDMAPLLADQKIAGIPSEIDIDSTLDELEKLDPDLDKHLYKLLQVAKSSPSKFKMLLSMLDQM